MTPHARTHAHSFFDALLRLLSRPASSRPALTRHPLHPAPWPASHRLASTRSILGPRSPRAHGCPSLLLVVDDGKPSDSLLCNTRLRALASPRRQSIIAQPPPTWAAAATTPVATSRAYEPPPPLLPADDGHHIGDDAPRAPALPAATRPGISFPRRPSQPSSYLSWPRSASPRNLRDAYTIVTPITLIVWASNPPVPPPSWRGEAPPRDPDTRLIRSTARNGPRTCASSSRACCATSA